LQRNHPVFNVVPSDTFSQQHSAVQGNFYLALKPVIHNMDDGCHQKANFF